jgi:cytochrome c5
MLMNPDEWSIPMLNNLKNFLLIITTATLITACGESETPASSGTSETAPAVAAPESPPAMETAPEEVVTEAETVIETAPESVPEVAEPEPAPITTPAVPVAPEEPAAEAPAATASLDGGQLYNTYCAICHRAGMNAAPKYGSKPLWAKRIAQGRETVYAHAINGLRGMPPRGGFAQLTDDEVKAATDYMVRAAGGWGDN